MSAPTLTRQQLRRILARSLSMEFPMRVGGDYSTLTGVTSTSVVTDTKLTQAPSFWKRSAIFMVNGNAAGDVRPISAFAAGVLTLEGPLSALPSVGDQYEIHSFWDAADIHAAINRALEDAFPNFYNQVIDETIPLVEDKIAYDIATALAIDPWIVSKIWAEMAQNVIRGAAIAGGASTLTDGAANWTANEHNGKIVTLYKGTGAGQPPRTVVSNTTTQLTITPAWSTIPASGTKYSLWDGNEQLPWYPVVAAQVVPSIWPDMLYLKQTYSSFWGMRLRISYASKPTQMTSESHTASVPQEFIIDKALAVLYAQRMDDTRVDRQRYEILANRHNLLAEAYRQSRSFPIPSTTPWQEEDENAVWAGRDDPLAWWR